MSSKQDAEDQASTNLNRQRKGLHNFQSRDYTEGKETKRDVYLSWVCTWNAKPDQKGMRVACKSSHTVRTFLRTSE